MESLNERFKKEGTNPWGLHPRENYIFLLGAIFGERERNGPLPKEVESEFAAILTTLWPQLTEEQQAGVYTFMHDGLGARYCYHCGDVVELQDGLVAYHDFPKPCRSICPGSKLLPVIKPT